MIGVSVKSEILDLLKRNEEKLSYGYKLILKENDRIKI